MVYAINGRSFNGLDTYEQMPLQKFFQLVGVHIAAVEAEKAAYEKARKKK